MVIAKTKQTGEPRSELGAKPRTINIEEAKARLSDLIARAEAGEDVIIARNGVPAARIVPLNCPIGDTVALLREERTQRPRVTAAEIRVARLTFRTSRSRFLGIYRAVRLGFTECFDTRRARR